MSDGLADKSEAQIRNAASLWFMAREAFRRGEQIPISVFALSVEPLTDADVEEAKRMFPSMFVRPFLTDEVINKFIETNSSVFKNVDTQRFMNEVRERDSEVLPCPFCLQRPKVTPIEGAGYSLVGCVDLECPAYSIACYPDEWNRRTTGKERKR